jgi:hypothetical protein
VSLGGVTRVAASTTWTVCASGCDYSSIKAAIAVSTTLDGDTLAIAAGTYIEAGITVDKSLTLQGERAASTIVQAAAARGTAPDRVFAIPSGLTATLQGLTIQYGHVTGYYRYGGGLINEGTLTLKDSIIRDNSTDYYGGGLHNAGTLAITNSIICGNSTSYDGGGLFNFGTLTLTASIVANNLDGGDCYNLGGGSIISQGYNLDSDGSCELTAPTDRPGTDPRLGPLQDNGGLRHRGL